MTHLIISLNSATDGDPPDVTAAIKVGDQSKSIERGLAMIIGATARLIYEQMMLCSDVDCMFIDDKSTQQSVERFKECGISVSVDRAKLISNIRGTP